ncbi:DNA circularization N-terminal domain-containing protein [Sphingomonas sp. AOB5]|uniref:DNA circularization protein n=1 Tax=Sphingomonas sp. AOB5 TaxID=3034017 RepID=UPI0023F8E9E1|nr:DNA circularization N-terminal domain-containing protein [Sphingomonas sp. AOB5]MDF7777839.1 DNA circularization N-terminal domain-containing protein [Sphingomonas sp. AOB5]
MSAPEGWQKGSFRGLSFVSQGQDQAGGRRIVVHEPVQAEKPITEDLGKKTGRFTLNCHIRGDDYIARADTFGQALNAKGAGTLVHPWLGPMQVRVEDFTRSDIVEEGAIAVFSVVFVESGLPAPPGPAIDTAALSREKAALSAGAAPVQFADRFALDGVQGFVEAHAAELVTLAASAMAVVSGLQGGIGPALAAIQANLGTLPEEVQAMLRSPVALGQTLVGAAQSILTVGGSGVSLIGGLIGLLAFGEDLPPIAGSTPARDRQRENQAAIVQLVNLAVAGTLVDAVAGTVFDSYQEAVAIRTEAADALDRLALRQADAGDDEGAAQYDALRLALSRDVTSRGGSLARLQDYTPAITEPAIVIAYRLYGPAALEDRTGEIVARNRIRHPGFVTGAVTLQVLTPELAIGGGRG